MCAVPQLEDLDLTDIDTVAVDLETYDPELIKKGSGAVKGKEKGFVCGVAIATKKQNDKLKSGNPTNGRKINNVYCSTTD